MSRRWPALEAAAAALAEDGRGPWADGLGRLAARVPLDGARPRVYVEVRTQPPTAATGCLPELLRWIGADPFMVPPASRSAEVSWEELLEFDPQLVVYAVDGQGTDYAPEAFLSVEGWDRSEAAVHRRVFSVGAAPEPGPALLEWARLLQDLVGEGFWGWPPAQASGLRRLGRPIQRERP